MELYKEKYGDKINYELAKDLVKDLAVTDDSGRETGEKWTMEEAKGMGDKVGIDFDKVSKCEFYLVLNMIYSDYFKLAHKYGLPEVFYGEMAKAWFDDEDGAGDKTFRYFIHF